MVWKKEYFHFKANSYDPLPMAENILNANKPLQIDMNMNHPLAELLNNVEN